jgi:HlyD family secretion protein
MSKKTIIILCSIFAAFVFAVMIVFAVAKARGGSKVVETEPIGKRTLSQKVTASGKLQATRKADLSATVFGQITNIAVKEGDKVKKGDILLQIDRAQASAGAGQSRSAIAAAVAEAGASEANLDQARKDLQRADANYKQHIISEAEYQRLQTGLRAQQGAADAARNRVQQARAQLAATSDSLNKTTIRAPMDGVVTRKAVEEGEMAVIGTMNNPGTVLLTVSDMSVLEAELEASETDVPQVRPGQTALISIDAFPGQKFDGVVTEVGASPWIKTDPGSTNTGNVFKVKVEVKNPPANVRPGFTVTADIETARKENALAVPLQAIVEKPPDMKSGPMADKKGDGPGSGAREDKVVRAADKVVDQLGVFIIDKAGKAQFVPVTTGVHGDLYIEATNGPKEGEPVIVGPFRILRELKIGDAVKVQKKAAPEGKK